MIRRERMASFGCRVLQPSGGLVADDAAAVGDQFGVRAQRPCSTRAGSWVTSNNRGCQQVDGRDHDSVPGRCVAIAGPGGRPLPDAAATPCSRRTAVGPRLASAKFRA